MEIKVIWNDNDEQIFTVPEIFSILPILMKIPITDTHYQAIDADEIINYLLEYLYYEIEDKAHIPYEEIRFIKTMDDFILWDNY